MAWRNFRELVAWALFATVTAVHLHSRTQLELCMTQLASACTQMGANTVFPLVQNSGAGLSDGPSGAVGYAEPLPDVKLADATSGGTPCSPISSAHGLASARMQL
jgi:hypothetical protein